MESIWKKGVDAPKFERLRGDLKTDVLIIGGGMTGLLCAHALKESGIDYALVEARSICSGTTGNTTAKITLQHGLIYSKLIKTFGKSFARGYLNANSEAVAAYGELCRKIECDYTECSAYVYGTEGAEKIENEARAYDELEYPAQLCTETELPFSVAGAVRVDGQASFNPYKFAVGIADGLKIYENTKVLELGRGFATVHGGKISAERIIVATHFPILNKHGLYPLKMYQHRSYVLALTGAAVPEGMYMDECEGGISLRGYGDTLVLGGGAHRTGKSGGGWAELEKFAKKHYTGAHVLEKWAAQDCMTLDSVPYIGEYSARTQGLYVATGFNKWGISSAMVAAHLLRDLMLGKENPYTEIFTPKRSILRKQLFINIGETVKSLLTLTAPRCPHLGCALKYNKAERSWDCPCHGSRFDESGQLIDNPATDDMKPPS